METKEFKVEITTPQKKWTFENVISCAAPGSKGNFQVLCNHAPMFSQLEIGSIKIETSEVSSLYATSGGFVEVLNNHVTFLLETCERADQIDVERARNAEVRARKRLKEQKENVDEKRAEAALRRALNRIRLAEKVH